MFKSNEDLRKVFMNTTKNDETPLDSINTRPMDNDFYTSKIFPEGGFKMLEIMNGTGKVLCKVKVEDVIKMAVGKSESTEDHNLTETDDDKPV